MCETSAAVLIQKFDQWRRRSPNARTQVFQDIRKFRLNLFQNSGLQADRGFQHFFGRPLTSTELILRGTVGAGVPITVAMAACYHPPACRGD
ncbi:hypothetical protein PXNS11_250138 [Stutzerimonas xanthomarina]|nr:hypothetical protein PXNS11_250138 [Stutzerimonas xanthomarina]